MKLSTTRFGVVDIPEDKILAFPETIPGFEGRRYTFIHDHDNPRVQWLQSVDEPHVALMTIDPSDLLIDYHPTPKPAELRTIRPEGAEDDHVVHRVIIRRGEGDGQLLVNLLAPVFINVDRRLGMQVLLVGSGYTVREVWPPPGVTGDLKDAPATE